MIDIILSAGSASCAGQIAELTVESSFSDISKLRCCDLESMLRRRLIDHPFREFAAICDVIIVDADMDPAIALGLSDLCTELYPSPAAVAVLHDQLAQRSFFQASGFKVPQVQEIDSSESALEAGRSFSYPIVIRHRIRGNGGEVTVMGEEHVDDALLTVGTHDVFAEQVIPFTKSLIVTIVRGRGGDRLEYPVSEELEGMTVCPAQLSAGIAAAAIQLAFDAVAALGNDSLFGLFAVKMLVMENGDLYLGEVTACPHRAGSASIDASGLSQYDAMLRLALNIPIPWNSEAACNRGAVISGVIAIKKTSEENTISIEAGRLKKLLSISDCHSHWYGSSEAHRGHLLGHVTLLAATIPLLFEKALAAGVDAGSIYNDAVVKKVASVAIVVDHRETLRSIAGAVKIFEEFNVAFDVSIASAHLTPSRVYSLAESAKANGYSVIIASSRGEAHLAHMIASLTTLPVIAHIVLDADCNSVASVRERSSTGHVVCRNGKDAALMAIRILSSSGNSTASQLSDLLEKNNSEQEAQLLRDALRVESVGYAQFISDMS